MRQADQKLVDMTRELDQLSVQSKMDADNNKNRIKDLDKSLAAAIAENKDLAKDNKDLTKTNTDLTKDFEKLQVTAGDSSDNEQSLLNRIAELESEVLLARKDASQSMMSRILDLRQCLKQKNARQKNIALSKACQKFH